MALPWSGSFLQHFFCPSSVTVNTESFWVQEGSRSSCPVGRRAAARPGGGNGGEDEGGAQLCCNVFDSIGGAESYRVSVSCVGSPANVHGLDSVPAPQSQKNLESVQIADRMRLGLLGLAKQTTRVLLATAK